MGLLDKLKPTPRWKHADPSVRLEAVRELEDATELAVLAETDPDARVRRAAVPRTMDAQVLGRMAAGDADPETRDRAADRLVALATAGSDADAAMAAVRALTDTRRLSAIARGEAAETVRTEALSRTTDERALAGVAKHAKHESTAAAAAARVNDRDALIEIAQTSEHKDVAAAAFERLVSLEGGVQGAPPIMEAADLALMRAIETRTTHKSVARRARAIIQEAEAAEAARLAAEEERRRREASLCDAVDGLASVIDPAATRAELSRLSAAWTALNVTDQASLDRFAAGSRRVEAAIATRERDIREAEDLARQRAEAIATRDAFCARVETLDGDDVLAQLVPIEEEWRSLTPLAGDGPEAARLVERFAKAVAACRKRHELGALLAETRAKYDALVSEAEALSSSDDNGAAAARWQSLSREARGHASVLNNASRPAPELDARLAAVGETLAGREAARDAERREALAKAQQTALGQVTRLVERARRASEADTITLREGDRLLRDITTGVDEAGKVEASREITEALASLRTLQEQVAPRVRELREMDEWRRFANAQRQEQLIAMAEAIVASLKLEAEQSKDSDLGATARALKELHAKWQEVAEAPRNSAQRLWDRFRTATDFIRSRCEPHFQKLREERGASLQKRTAIVEEAEALANASDWARTAARFQELQKAWEEAGAAPRDAGRDLAQRFRTASNTFFTRRREDLASRKKVWTDNLAAKDALVKRAEELSESTEWDAASAEFKRMQAAWKNIGPVRRSKSEEVWNRFRAAADKFFERYHNRHNIALAGKLAEREAMVVEMETLAAADASALPADLAAQVQQQRTTWNRAVPIPVAEAKVLAERWQTALKSLIQKHRDAFKGTDLDPDAAKHRLEKLIARVETYLEDAPEPMNGMSATEALAAKLRSALASNAMGKSSNEEAKWRAAAEGVKEAQAAWARLAPVAGSDAAELEGQFREACRRVNDLARRHQPQQQHRSSSAPPRRMQPPRPTAAVGA
ncbi:MAG TPA: DUF349 domain-containing protein [Vicinamibacterales bacterium]|nr:DUF349 domain-containing protein [Vicinamibacterales bacterium]